MKNLKVALIGNMNNNNFVLLRCLLDQGIDVNLLILKNEPAHFSPGSDTNEIEKYNDKIKIVKWGDRKDWFSISGKEINNDLKLYNFLIGTDLAPAFCGRAQRNLDIFVPHGSDLGHFTYYKLTWPNKLIQTWFAVYMQRKYIPKVKYFHMEGSIELYEKRWMKFKGNSIRWTISMPLVYKEKKESVDYKCNIIKNIKKIKKESDLTLYYNVRHVWGGDKNKDANQKGSDKVLRGLSLFKERNPEIIFNLITFEYGTKVNESKKLIKKLKLEENIKWFPLSERKNIIVGMQEADLVLGEFENSWVTYSVIAEALSLNKPIITYREDECHIKTYNDLYYILNAKTDVQICEKIEYYLKNKNEVIEKSSRGWDWYKSNINIPAISLYTQAIQYKS